MTLREFEALGFATAAALCALLLFTYWRAGDHSARRTYAWLWISGFVYASAAFAAASFRLASGGESRANSIAEAFIWSSTCFGPWIFAALGDPHVGSPAIRRTLRLLALTACFALAARLITVTLATDFAVSDSTFPAHSFYVSVGFATLYIAAAIASPPKPRREITRAKWFAPVVTMLVIVQTIATIAGIHDVTPVGFLQTAIRLVSVLWVLPWTIVLSFFLAQTRYADVALKRSLVLVGSVIVAAALALTIPDAQRGLPYVVATLAMAGAMLAAPIVRRVIDRFVDRTLLRRPQYDVLARGFAEEARRLAHPEELLAAAERTIDGALRIDAHFVRKTSEAPIKIDERVATIPAGQNYVLELKALHGARTLMNEEFAFLESIAAEVAHRLESLDFETERRERQVREERLQHSVTEAELRALRAQVDPHFLFNALNTIADHITSNPEQAEAMTERLAECFRYTLSRQDKTLSTLDEELQFIRRYLDIEQVRFGERLTVQLHSDEGIGHEKVPSLILQPLVENAVRHGLAPKPEGGKLRISARRAGPYIHLEVADDGVGIPSREQHRIGIGIKNVRERLQTLYRERAQMSIEPGALGRGTCVTLFLPV